MSTLLRLILLTLCLSFTNSAQASPKINADNNELASDESPKRLGDFEKFHFFGYGELHLNNNIGPTPNEIDFHRMVFGFGYDFTDKIRYRMELDFEHAFTEPELEYSYLEFDIKKWANIRAGALLLPMGVINENHEPPLFNGVERPNIYRVILPTTWQEAGAGFFGNFANGFEYQIYAMSSLSAVALDGGAIDRSFNGSNGVRGGRGAIAEAPGGNFAGAGRLQYTGLPGFRAGTSFFLGETGQNEIDGALLTILEADAKYSFAGFDLEGIVAWTHLGDADEVNNVLVGADPTFTNFVASQMFGWYLEGAYHVFHHLIPNTKHDLIAFGRYEEFNTQFKMPDGFTKNNANDRKAIMVGARYLPIPQIAVKADYSFNWNEANAGVDQFNVGLGFYY